MGSGRMVYVVQINKGFKEIQRKRLKRSKIINRVRIRKAWMEV